MNFHQQYGIQTMDWPPLSSDPIPIEHLCDLLGRRIRTDQRLTNAVIVEWDNIYTTRRHKKARAKHPSKVASNDSYWYTLFVNHWYTCILSRTRQDACFSRCFFFIGILHAQQIGRICRLAFLFLYLQFPFFRFCATFLILFRGFPL